MRRVGLLINSMAGGGAERVAALLANHLCTVGYDVHLIAMEGGSSYYQLHTKVHYGILTPRLLSGHGLLSRAVAFLYQVVLLARYIRAHNLDVVISLLQRASFVNLTARPFARHRTVTTAHTVVSHRYARGVSGRVVPMLIRLLWPKSDRIVAVSRGVAQDLVETFGLNEVSVIHNPLDIAGIQRMAEEPLEKEIEDIFKKPVVINAGSLRRVKGQWHLIRAFKKVKDVVHDCQLVILGDGELLDYLKTVARELEVERDVHLFGWQSNPFKFISRGKLFALTSTSESFTLSLLEAMVCRCPIVSSDCYSAPREILAPDGDFGRRAGGIEFAEYGVLVPPLGEQLLSTEPLTREEELLAQAMIHMLSNDELRERYGQRGVMRSASFSVDAVAAQYVDVIESLLDKVEQGVA